MDTLTNKDLQGFAEYQDAKNRCANDPDETLDLVRAEELLMRWGGTLYFRNETEAEKVEIMEKLAYDTGLFIGKMHKKREENNNDKRK